MFLDKELNPFSGTNTISARDILLGTVAFGVVVSCYMASTQYTAGLLQSIL